MRVLAIEDDRTVASAIELGLNKAGIECDVAGYGAKGLEFIRSNKHGYDLIILDLMLPDTHGHEVLKQIKLYGVKTPVLILSALSKVDHKIEGLEIGADDYMTKPFNMEELLARIRALTRRSIGHAGSELRVGGLRIDMDARIVEVDGKPLNLTTMEYAIMEFLALHNGSLATIEMLLEHVYSGEVWPDQKIIAVIMCKIRRKLYEASGGKNYIETVWGKGYMLPNVSEARKESAKICDAKLLENIV